MSRTPSVNRSPRTRASIIALIPLALATAGLASCGPGDPQPSAEPSTTVGTTSSVTESTTTISLAPTSTPEDVLCGDELPVFPKISIRGVDVGDSAASRSRSIDVEGTPGPADGAEPALANQVVRHWPSELDFTIEIRWPAGPGPVVDSTTVLTQLVETGSPQPCHVARVSGYGDEDPLTDHFAAFVDSLDGIDAKPAFVAEQEAAVTQAEAAEPGKCDEPVISETLDELGEPELDAVKTLLERYTDDRGAAAGYEACFTVIGLREFEALAEGQPDLVRPSEVYGSTAEALVSFLDADPLRVSRETLDVIAIPVAGGHQLLFGGITTGPDSNVGEEEAIAFIDEFLLLLTDSDFDGAAGYFLNEGVSDSVVDAMPTFLDDPGDALRRYCREALCAGTYKINETVAFDANSRTVDVTLFGEDDTIEHEIEVGVFEGQLMLLTPPPLLSGA